MDFRCTKDAAERSLSAASYDPKKLTLLHTGAALLLSLVLTVLNLVLAKGIDTTGGLAGIGTRSVLQVIQSVLSLFSTVALPFWELGFVFAVIGFARQDTVTPGSLAEGFRRFGPALRLFLLQLVLYVGVGFACMYLSSMIFAMTPFFADMVQIMEPLLEQASTGELITPDLATTEAVLKAAVPMYVIFGLLFAAVAIPLAYRFRMARYAIMDDAPGALAAMSASGRMMRGNRIALFKLDLNFWWYYGAQLALSALAYGDVLLGMTGITLPVDGELLFFGFYILYLLLDLGFAWLYKAKVETAYAHCYDMLRAATPTPTPEQPPVPKQLP